MSVGAAVALAPLLLVNDDFLEAALLHHLRLDAGAVDQRRPDLHAAAVTGGEDFIELDFGTGIAVELLDTDDVAGFNAVLFAARSDHCIAHG